MNDFKIAFKAIPENEAFIRIAISGFLLYLDPSVEELNDIKTAVSEGVTNVILHAYKDCIGDVELYCCEDNRKIKITIKDNGIGIDDIEKAKEAFYTSDLSSERAGLGFTVMEAFMDEFQVESYVGNGTTITMSKQLSMI